MRTTLADILRRHWSAYAARHGVERIPPSHHAAVGAILSCHTAARGGSRYQCACGQEHFTFHGCGHRACPQCGQREAEAWIEAQRARLLPVPYHLVTFTVPEELRMVVRSNQRVLLGLLFKESAATMQEVAASKLRAELGFMGALHTWSRQLVYHPHVHYVVPALGLSPAGSPVTPPDPAFLLPVRVLSRRFRSRLLRALERDHPGLAAQVPRAVWRKDWVVHSQPAGSGKEALAYLSRYIYRTALSHERQLEEANGIVSFGYRDWQTGERKTARLPAMAFIARFLQHVLPKRFRRVRACGWLAPAAKKRLERLRALLDALPPANAPKPVARRAPVAIPCPRCGKTLRLVGTFGRAPPPC